MPNVEDKKEKEICSEEYDKAVNLRLAGKWSEAKEQYQKVINDFPSSRLTQDAKDMVEFCKRKEKEKIDEKKNYAEIKGRDANYYEVLSKTGKIFGMTMTIKTPFTIKKKRIGLSEDDESIFNNILSELKDDEKVFLATVTNKGDFALLTNQKIVIRKNPRYQTSNTNLDINYSDIVTIKEKQNVSQDFKTLVNTGVFVKSKDTGNPAVYVLHSHTNPEFPVFKTICTLVQEQKKIQNLKTCPKCNSKNDPESVFCGECGEKFEETTVNNYCPDCGTLNKGKNKFCEKCGIKLGD